MRENPPYECDLCGEPFETAAAKGGHMARHKKYVPPIEKLLAIRELATELGRPPTQAEMNEQGRLTYYTIADEFGSWNEGLRAAGLEPAHEKNISEEALLEEIRRLGNRLGRVPTISEMADSGTYSVDAVARAFGSWTAGVRAAGFEPAGETWSPATRVSKREIVLELQSLASELDRAPCARDVNQHGSLSAQTVRSRFESFDAAVRAAGLEPYHPREANAYSEREIIDAIRSVAADLGKPPTVEEMTALGDCSPTAAERLFGSWNEAIRAAGFEPRLRSGIPTSELLDAIDELADRLGRAPQWADNRREGEFSVTTYTSRFGSWANALEAAGYDLPDSPRTGRWERDQADGGEIFYGDNWQRQRRRALERDGYRCQAPDCEITEAAHIDRHGTGLEVHHRKPLRTFREGGEIDHERANRLNNLVTLCRAHHAQWEYYGPSGPDI